MSILPPGNSIACYGDSLTSGFRGPKLSTLLAHSLPGRTIDNYGISGQTAQQIAARQGGQPALLTLDGNAFAGTTAVRVTNLSTPLLSTPDSTDTTTLSGTLNGTRCLLTRSVTGAYPSQTDVYTVSPVVSSTQAVPANSPFYPDSADTSRTFIQTLWLGRNNLPNLTGVDNLIDACVAYLIPPKRFVVIGVLNAVGENPTTGTAYYQAILNMNALLAKTYPLNYVPSTPPTPAELAPLNYTATAQDITDMADGAIPRGMRSDQIHLNATGCQLIANRVVALIKDNDW